MAVSEGSSPATSVGVSPEATVSQSASVVPPFKRRWMLNVSWYVVPGVRSCSRYVLSPATELRMLL
eukprot:1783939-Pyramimonas_sp.AAC.1